MLGLTAACAITKSSLASSQWPGAAIAGCLAHRGPPLHRQPTGPQETSCPWQVLQRRTVQQRYLQFPAVKSLFRSRRVASGQVQLPPLRRTVFGVLAMRCILRETSTGQKHMPKWVGSSEY